MIPVRDESDDWFERALEDAEESATDDDDAADEPSGDGTAEQFDALGGAETTVDGDESAEAASQRETADEGNDGSEGEGELFDEDFGAALADVDAPNAGADETGPEGFSELDFGLAAGNETDFDEAVDSDLPRLELGIEGLDRMIQGGVPERSLLVAMGSAGTGKTTFGLQFLEHGLARGENAVYITLEESRRRVIDSATEKGYPFDEYLAEDRLAVVDVDPVEMANSLQSITNELPTLIEEFDAARLVLDSVSLLEMMYEDRATRRNEIYDFTRSLKEAGVTALLTSEASEESPYASRYGIVEYLTDAVFVLQYVRPDDFRETRLAVEIQKIRDANHSREKKPYEITDEGISVYQQANLF
ncbi:KaiC domain-containing protein [Haloterrigena sp. SYSU A558-1]|uniref:KaiC domain-containing protein n=1 Tax=Haloterrigena gelatinilytica TaxID=2741724 RepID=A0ABX2LCZ1_9EURY|nr:KaiC domain-containing protein [Haloterrigena gelatinilytica]NUC73571.1 KaiC domain-containing protein [Haloterrigena gelatinilytica]